MNAVVIIPARGGSKGVPRKNVKKLNNVPLIHYSILAALDVFPKTSIIVSTDDEEIKAVAEETGITVPFLRPSNLATDVAGTYEVLIHALDHLAGSHSYPDTLILLQPTSPFRTADHIREALQLYTPDVDMVVSVKETRANPYYVLFEEGADGYLLPSKKGSFVRRQDCPQVWEYNGAIYIINVSSLRQRKLSEFTKIRKFVMDEFSSHDIDTMLDWKIAEVLINEKEDTRSI